MKLDRQALLRLCLVFHWAWLTILFSQVLHNIMAILFVAVIPMNRPDDWPPLYGSPRHAYSLRGSWDVLVPLNVKRRVPALGRKVLGFAWVY